jgi:hypothetical protein
MARLSPVSLSRLSAPRHPAEQPISARCPRCVPKVRSMSPGRGTPVLMGNHFHLLANSNHAEGSPVPDALAFRRHSNAAQGRKVAPLWEGSTAPHRRPSATRWRAWCEDGSQPSACVLQTEAQATIPWSVSQTPRGSRSTTNKPSHPRLFWALGEHAFERGRLAAELVRSGFEPKAAARETHRSHPHTLGSANFFCSGSAVLRAQGHALSAAFFAPPPDAA